VAVVCYSRLSPLSVRANKTLTSLGGGVMRNSTVLTAARCWINLLKPSTLAVQPFYLKGYGYEHSSFFIFFARKNAICATFYLHNYAVLAPQDLLEEVNRPIPLMCYWERGNHLGRQTRTCTHFKTSLQTGKYEIIKCDINEATTDSCPSQCLFFSSGVIHISLIPINILASYFNMHLREGFLRHLCISDLPVNPTHEDTHSGWILPKLPSGP